MQNQEMVTPLPSLPVIVLIVAVVMRLVVKPAPRGRMLSSTSRTRDTARPVTVLVCMDASDAWREYINHIIMRCRDVATVHVLLAYRSADDVPDSDVSDPIYRHLVNIEMGIQRSRHPSKNLQRLVRRFVTGSEKTVVVLQAGCSLHDDFARTILEVQERLPDGAIVSCPTSHTTGVARFPTLRVRSNGSVARDGSKPFHANSLQHTVELVPNVTWCPEMTICNGLTLKRWSQTTSESFLEHVRRIPEVSHLIPSHPLLAHNARVEDDVLDFDEGLEGYPISDAERVGITATSSSNERMVKYGTLFRARVAIESARD